MERKEPRPDLSENPSGIDEVIERQRLRERNLCLVKVTGTTWIAVPSKKNNKEYVDFYKKERMGLKKSKL